MAFFRKFIAEKIKGRSGSKAVTHIENVHGVPIHDLKSMTEFLEVGSQRVWASFRACHITASALLSTEFYVRGRSNWAAVEDTAELGKLLANPNPFDSWEEMLYQWVFHMKLTGRAFWLKDEMDSRGRPRALYPLLPQYVRVFPHKTEKISHYEYKVGGAVIRMERDEVIMFRRPHPRKPLEGLGDVEGGEQLMREFIMRNQVEENFISKGAMPSGILTKEETVEDQTAWNHLKARWVADYTGVKNAGKVAFMNGKWLYQQMGLSQAEMQSLEKEQWSVKAIFALHGVPLSMAGIEAATNYATAKQDEINFRKYELVPLVDLFVGRLNSGTGGNTSLIGAYSPQWELAYEMAGLIDVGGVVADYMPLVTEGAMTLNELRELTGLGRIDNPLLDQHYVGQGRMPLELAGFTAPTEGMLSAGAEAQNRKMRRAVGDVTAALRAGGLSGADAAEKLNRLLTVGG